MTRYMLIEIYQIAMETLSWEKLTSWVEAKVDKAFYRGLYLKLLSNHWTYKWQVGKGILIGKTNHIGYRGVKDYELYEKAKQLKRMSVRAELIKICKDKVRKAWTLESLMYIKAIKQCEMKYFPAILEWEFTEALKETGSLRQNGVSFKLPYPDWEVRKSLLPKRNQHKRLRKHAGFLQGCSG